MVLDILNRYEETKRFNQLIQYGTKRTTPNFTSRNPPGGTGTGKPSAKDWKKDDKGGKPSSSG